MTSRSTAFALSEASMAQLTPKCDTHPVAAIDSGT
jgi:hypothetical protein